MKVLYGRRTIKRVCVIGAALLLAAIGIGASQQQAASPAMPVRQVVRVRTGSSCGWCSEGYNDNETIIEPGWITTISRSYTN